MQEDADNAINREIIERATALRRYSRKLSYKMLQCNWHLPERMRERMKSREETFLYHNGLSIGAD